MRYRTTNGADQDPALQKKRPVQRPAAGIRHLLPATLALLLAGCSVKQFAIKQLGNALSESAGGAFAAESDVEFAGQAVPFSLKLIESLLEEAPDHQGLLTAAASGFTQYAYVWVQQPADFIEADDFAEAQRQRDRARAFYLRANGYAMHGLEAAHQGFSSDFSRDPHAAVAVMKKSDIPLLYWAAASLGSAITLGKTDPSLVARQPEIEALIDRAVDLDPDWNHGALHEFLIAYEPSRIGAAAGSAERAREHFDLAVAQSRGRSAAPYVTLAETISVQEQNRAEFTELLQRALSIDPEKTKDIRLANVVTQERARWLLDRVDDLFLE